MFRSTLRRRVAMLFVLVAAFALITSGGSKAAFHSPGTCDFQNESCVASCPIDPATGEVEEVCATQCRYSKTVCENDIFGSNLSPDNFLLPVNVGCSKFYTSYRGNCMNGGMIPRHVPVYNACIASGFSQDECCSNLANDFAMSISFCEEF